MPGNILVLVFNYIRMHNTIISIPYTFFNKVTSALGSHTSDLYSKVLSDIMLFSVIFHYLKLTHLQ